MEIDWRKSTSPPMSITIKHREGNLAEGQSKEQTFGDSVDTITFGRERDCQVVYAPEYTVVGKRHFQLQRQVTGDYRVNLLGQRYVEINGVPADNNAPVPNRAVFRLGDKKNGPSFEVRIDKAAAELPPTAPQTPVKTWRDMLMKTRRLGAIAASLLAVVVLGTSY